MRIQRLDLTRYGPFTDKTLNFRRGATLHLVFGPNEAGKSSSLAAIGDLLFGFARRKEFDFLHEASTLRVGAEIFAQNGEKLVFRRRRGNKKTLISADAEEMPLQDDALAPFLGNLTREVFARAFGLNSDTLRAGGEAMLESDGEMGATLFAAASGLTGLARVRRTLEAEAETIFAPRASKERSFYRALEHYDVALAAERQNELKAGDWKALVNEIESIEGQLADIRERRAATGARLARLQRLKLLQPIVRAIDELTRPLAAFDDLPEVPEGFVAQCAAALEEAEGAGGIERAATEDVEAAAEALAAIDFDEGYAQRSDEIVDAFSRKGDYVSKLGELLRVERERDAFEAQLAEVAQRLGLADAEMVVELMPPDAAMEYARGLIVAGPALEAALRADEKHMAEEQIRLEIDETDNLAGHVVDPKPWRDQFAALAPDINQLGEESLVESSLRTTADKLDHTAARMVPPVRDVEAIARAVLPARETIAAHKAAFEKIIADKQAAALRVEANAAETGQTLRLLAETERSGPVAYAETISLVRADRDRTFEELRRQLARAGTLLTPLEVSEKLVQYEEEIAEADSIADQAIADADRISRLANYRIRLDELEHEMPENEARLADLAEQQTRAAQAYAALFADAGITPIGPDAMITWLATVDDLLAMRAEVEELSLRINRLGKIGRQVHSALLRIAEGIGIEGAEKLPALALSRLIAAGLDEMQGRWSARLTFETARQSSRMRVGQTEDAVDRSRRAYEDWAAKYEAMLPSIGLPPGTSPGAAGAALAAWVGVPEIIRQRANRAQRAEALQRDVAAFEETVFHLGEALAKMHSRLPAQVLVDLLRDLSETSRSARVRREEAQLRLDAAKARLAEAGAANAAAQTALQRLAAMLPEGAEPRIELARLERRDALRQKLAERRREFEAHADDFSEAAIREDLPKFERDRAHFDAEELARTADSLHAENNRLYALLGQKQARREALEQSTGAELAAFERSSAETEIVTIARRWAVRRIAATMLSAAIDKHRESQSDPLLLRAGTLFSTLTGKSFTGLLQDYGEDDQPRLVGVRRSGERVAVAGMSEGTRDQLYLSLRLAYIEDYADRTEPVPFIGDDIFQTFDDERTTAGIKAFASTSALFQPILFTHHLSVVAIARRTLGEELDYIEL